MNLQDSLFERTLLREIVADARKAGAKIRKAWVHKCDERGRWEFVYGEFSTTVSAETAWGARALGWEQWLAQTEKACG